MLLDPQTVDPLAIRTADAGRLSLALMDARNRTLGWLAAFDGLALAMPVGAPFAPPGWLAGQAGWFQEWWVGRHVQRGRGAAADPHGPRLASLDPRADGWFDPRAAAAEGLPALWDDPPPADAVRGFLAATLDATLELLDKVEAGDDTALHVFRMALAQEDRIGEALAQLAQALGLPDERRQALLERGLWPDWPARARREPLVLSAQALRLGAAADAWAPDAEQGLCQEAVPEGDIDAQPVCWAQMAEFIGDGGYQERRWWSDEGWHWLHQVAQAPRAAPRHAQAVAGAVMGWRLGAVQRLPGQQPVMHASVHEAEAWCRWAGRRLPTEAEWELAARQGVSRGFVWGDVHEWVLGTARPYPAASAPRGTRAAAASRTWVMDLPQLDLPWGVSAEPQAVAADAAWPGWRVLRGASRAGSPRLAHPAARRFAPAGADQLFAGFRSCAW